MRSTPALSNRSAAFPARIWRGSMFRCCGSSAIGPIRSSIASDYPRLTKRVFCYKGRPLAGAPVAFQPRVAIKSPDWTLFWRPMRSTRRHCLGVCRAQSGLGGDAFRRVGDLLRSWGVLVLMRELIVSRLSRRAFLGATAAAAFAVSFSFGASAAEDQDAQAEWPQSYEASPQMAVGRESTPILSPETVAATESAIERYQGIVAKGGWIAVPAGADLRIGSKGPRVQALRDRLVASGDLDPIAGAGPIYDSFVEAAVKRFQARHGISETGVVNG